MDRRNLRPLDEGALRRTSMEQWIGGTSGAPQWIGGASKITFNSRREAPDT